MDRPLVREGGKRRLFVVSGERFDHVLLGPASRQIELAQGGILAGVETILVGASCSRALPSGMRFRDISSFRIEEIRPSDALIVSAYMPGRWIFHLLRSGHPFHVDLYCVTATEILPGLDALPGWKAWHQRWRRVLRYASLCARAETVYVSNSCQTTLLGGMFFALPGRAAQRLAFGLPAKTVVAPMVPSSLPFPRGNPSPYPSELHGKPVFLWGGGIWKWFDVGTVLDAFAILRERGSDARLFFLTGRNPSNHADQDAPHRDAIEAARKKGLLDVNVFFNEKTVSPGELASYLEHCHAGILANGAHLESTASWRTRQLDLLWAGKPAVVSGDDPLSRRMAESGAAWIGPAGDAQALARHVETSLQESEHGQASRAAERLGVSISRETAGVRVAEALGRPGGFRDMGVRIDPLWLVRYILGL